MTKPGFYNPVFVALDTADISLAVQMAQVVMGHVGGLKLGLEFFCAHGPQGVRILQDSGLPIFLDLKLHDIPNTVAGALQSLVPLAPAFITLHAQGGVEMMKRGADQLRTVAAKAGIAPPKLLGVTIMTSLDGQDLQAQGGNGDVGEQVRRLASLVVRAGLDGIVCSPHEVAHMREFLGSDMMLIVPGIRPAGADADDQKRVMTPKDAIARGADILVIGRPITQARDPGLAARQIAAQLV